MSSNFQKVCTFNRVFGVPHFDEKQEHIDPKLFKLRVDLCKEELNELDEAFRENNLIEVIDALADEAYVIYGLASSFGINMDSEFYKYMISPRMSHNIKPELSDFNKVKNWLSDQSQLFPDAPTLDNINITNINQMKTVIKNLETIENWDTYIGHLCCLLFQVYSMALYCGIDLDKAFAIVHDSNMSKLCKSEEEAQQTVKHYIEHDKRYDSPKFRESVGYWVIYNESTGKILKSINYTPANFDKLI